VKEYTTSFTRLTSGSNGKQYLSLIHNINIPNQISWTVKMWHFEQYALTSYLGEKFENTRGDSLTFFRYYSRAR
jgi:hypothetical protein